MSVSLILVTLFELAAIILFIWGLFNEKKLIAWERKQFQRMKRRILAILGRAARWWLSRGEFPPITLDMHLERMNLRGRFK